MSWGCGGIQRLLKASNGHIILLLIATCITCALNFASEMLLVLEGGLTRLNRV